MTPHGYCEVIINVSTKKVDLIMKIAILGTRGIPARYGGFETFAERLAVGLSARGFDVTVFCESGESSAPEVFQGVNLHYISAPSLGPLQTILYDLRCLWAARRDYDVVYMLGYGSAPFCLIPRLWGAEVWINPDGLEWARAKWGRLAKLYFRLMEWASLYAANRIIADAEAIATSLIERHGKIRACSVIAYGCDVTDKPPADDKLSEWELRPGSYYLVVCRLEPENHVLEILEAFKESDSKRQLIVVGNHFVATDYVTKLRTVQDPRIRMIGTVFDQDKLTSLRYHSFAYIHGHSVGGTNPSLLEAMGCMNLIFAHDNVFNRETLASAGYFFSNVSELTLAIERSERDESDLTPLREAAFLRARANYSWPDIIANYASLLERVYRS
jgi:glycosyltransferase involved in cell wall biosynthesis